MNKPKNTKKSEYGSQAGREPKGSLPVKNINKLKESCEMKYNKIG